MTTLTPQQFAENWKNTTLKERQSYQIHFMDLCDLVGHERPSGAGIDAAGHVFAFEWGIKKDGGGQGFADVFYDGHFAIEYKAPGKYKDLNEAYQQLLQYRERLRNPPLLIVTDIATWEIHTNWPNTEKKVYTFSNADIANRPSVMKMLRDLFDAPERLHPDRNTAQVTTDAADVFRVIADDMRRELGSISSPPSPSASITPPPNPLPDASGRGNQDAQAGDYPSPSQWGGDRGGVEGGWIHTHTNRDLYDKIKPLARQMRTEPTAAEAALWERLRHKQLEGYKFRRQHTIDRFIVDFYSAEGRLVIEVDGPIHDYTLEEDALRQAFLESLGLRVLRFRNEQVFGAIEDMVEEVVLVLSTPPPNPNVSGDITPPPNPLPDASGRGNQSGVGERDLSERIAHFLTKLVFCLFAEDVQLLPPGPKGTNGIFAEIVEQTYREPSRFTRYAEELFKAMAEGGEVMFQKIPYFNGSLFDDVTVEAVSPEALGKLLSAVSLNWESVEPAIFGTLFERSLDPSKRAQLGAHYTSRADILLIVEPVLMQPLRREWAAIQAEAAPIRAKLDAATTPKERITGTNQLQALREQMLKRLREIKVLDPACGSGNFLYVSLQLLMDMEKAVITDSLFEGLTLALPEVHPRQMYGIEINPIAHDLASIVVWIGYIQWRQNNGYATLTRREPILEALGDNIRLMDAVLTPPPNPLPIAIGRGNNAVAEEPEWPEVDVIVGNPPFLGGSKIRGELGDEYVEKLWKLYDGRVPGGADLVTYWFEKARAHITAGKAKRAGLLATNSIRGGANREVLKRIKESGDIFMAWSDRDWVLDGAAVRVSMVGFRGNTTPPPNPLPDASGRGSHEASATGFPSSSQWGGVRGGVDEQPILDGLPVATINPDLTANLDITMAKHLVENERICYRSDEKGGPFDIDSETAKKMLLAKNASGKDNADVVRPYMNGLDVTRGSQNMWVIDFGVDTALIEASAYEIPFTHVQRVVKPIRDKVRNEREQANWWLHRRPAPDMRKAVQSLKRYLATPSVAKHRLFVWLDTKTIPDHQLYIIAREDDYFFGVLHSRIHEIWSLRMGTWLGVGNDPRYTPTTTFETFPFPWKPGAEVVSHPAYGAVSAAAKQLHEERHAWLNPSGLSEKALKERTLTNLYNALNVWRGKESMKTKSAAADFAPRLADLHDALDKAVCDAYGWPHAVLADDEAILARLLALNLERSGE